MAFYSWLVSKIRGIRYSVSAGFSNRLYSFGAIYHGSYTNFKHDPNPLIFCLYSDAKYTHGINIHYLSESDKAWLAKSIYMIRKYNQTINGKVFYQYLKLHRMSIVKTAYRVYFTNLTKYKMVSAGMTPLDKLVYPSTERFVKMLNEMITPEKLSAAPRNVSYSQDELNNRIMETLSAVPIHRTPLDTQEVSGSMGKAKWKR